MLKEMGKTKKLIEKLFTGKKGTGQEKPTSLRCLLNESENFTRSSSFRNHKRQPESPQKRRRWGFLRAQHRIPTVPPEDHEVPESWIVQKKVVAVTAAAAKPVGAAAYRRAIAVGETAAVTIQSAFRSYLARKALKALKGLVKVQALVRGYLVRKRTTVILHSMQSIATAQARARSQRINKNGELNSSFQRQPNQRKSVDRRSRQSTSQMQERDWKIQGNIKIVQMDVGESKRSTNSGKSNSSRPRTAESSHRSLKGSTNSTKSNSSRPRTAETSHRSLKGCVTIRTYSKQERGDNLSIKSSALTDSSRGARSSPQYCSSTAQSSPQDASTAQSSPQDTSMASIMSENPSNPETFHRVFLNRAYSKQEYCQDISLQPSALVDSSPRADGGRFDDYYLDTAQSIPHASSRSSKPECLSFENEMSTLPANLTNTEPYRVKAERSRSAPRNTRADLIAGSPSRKKAAPAAGTRLDSNEVPLSTKLARVGGPGKKRDYGSSSSHTGHTNSSRNYGSSPTRTAHINIVKNYGSSPSRTGHTNTAKNYGSSPSRAGHTNTVSGISHSTWKL